MAEAAARLEIWMPSAGWPVRGDSSLKLAVRSDQPQLRCTPTPAASTAVPGDGGAGPGVIDRAVNDSPQAALAAGLGYRPAATAAAKDTDPRYPPTMCGHILLKQAM